MILAVPMASRRTRSKIQLRPIIRSKSLDDKPKRAAAKKTVEEQREYERLKKQKQRALKRCAEKGPAKRGPKTTVNIKEMTADEKKAYNREKQKISRAAKKLKLMTTDDIDIEDIQEDDNAEIDDPGALSTSGSVDFNIDAEIEVFPSEEGATVLRLINSPSKKRKMPRQIDYSFRKALSKLDENEILDVAVSMAHQLPESVKQLTIDFGVEVKKIPKSFKRSPFSDISTSTKHRYKEDLVRIMNEFNDVTAAHGFVTLVLKTKILSEELITKFSKNGIEITLSKIPSRMRITEGVNKVAKAICSPEPLEFQSTTAQLFLILRTAKEGNLSVDNRGDITALAQTFSISRKKAARILQCLKDGTTDELYSHKRKSLKESEWPELIKAFCLTKPICREAPGETVSVSYGERAEKYIRQFSIEEIYGLFRKKYTDFTYKLSSFRKFIPKNLVSPTLRDVKRNVCPIHENLRRSVMALNRFFIKEKKKDLLLSSSTIDLCLMGICHPNIDEDKRNPLAWKMQCTKGLCHKCGFEESFNSLKKSIRDNHLSDKFITHTKWITEYEGKKSKLVVRKFTSKIDDFVNDSFIPSLSTEKFSFPEHLRKAWRQWELTKTPLVLAGEVGDVAIRTREDYQQDLKYLCLSETVSTHRGVGVITMLCYPVVLEIFHANTDKKELHGVIYMSDSKNKNFDTVYKFENLLLDYVEDLGYRVQRYDRITDGCGSQFWCWGSMKHLENMSSRVPLINFHRYERYEGKNMSDALGSMLKRKSNDSALRQRVNALDEEGTAELMEDIESGTHGEELVFENHYDAFCWLKEMMSKSGDKFSNSFDKIELIWVPKEDIPKGLLVEKEVRKIPSVKAYNCATKALGKTGVYVKDCSCNCDNCAKNTVFECSNEVETGLYKNQSLEKKVRTGKSKSSSKKMIETDDESEGEERDTEIDMWDCSDIESDYFESSDSSDSELSDEEVLQDFEHDDIPITTSPLNPGLYILYQYSDTKFYVGCILATLPEKRQVRFLRKDAVKGLSMTFCWPDDADEPIIDVDILQAKSRPLPDPILLRRGNIQYPSYVFDNMSLNMIY